MWGLFVGKENLQGFPRGQTRSIPYTYGPWGWAMGRKKAAPEGVGAGKGASLRKSPGKQEVGFGIVLRQCFSRAEAEAIAIARKKSKSPWSKKGPIG